MAQDLDLKNGIPSSLTGVFTDARGLQEAAAE